MIGKVTRGTNVRGLIRYLYGPGAANEHTDPPSRRLLRLGVPKGRPLSRRPARHSPLGRPPARGARGSAAVLRQARLALRGTARPGSHPHRGDAGPPGRPAPCHLERLLKGPRRLPVCRTPPGLQRTASADRTTARRPTRAGMEQVARTAGSSWPVASRTSGRSLSCLRPSRRLNQWPLPCQGQRPLQLLSPADNCCRAPTDS
jgi:hypothetical protein